MKKLFKYILSSIGALVIILLIYAVVNFAPIMSGMAAKTMCSCVYVMGRSPESVTAKELTVQPDLRRVNIEFRDSTAVTASFLGFSRTAIYRKGIGCTLIEERSEEEIRKQEFELPSPPAIDQDTVAWPMGNKLPSTQVSGVEYNLIGKAIHEAFVETDPEKPKNTFSVVVVYDGQIIGEEYAPGFNYNSKLMGWSMTKSFTSALIGILVSEGKLKLDDPAPVEEWSNDDRRSITLNNLLQASSGLEWNESYFKPGDFHDMFMFSDDKGGFAMAKDLEFQPGTFFEYSSATTNLLSKIVRQTVGDKEYYKFPYEKLFYKAGMYNTMMEPDASGTFVGSSYGYASARDWARFGLLFLNNGKVNAEQILPEDWVRYSITPAPAAPMGQYGAQWWLNAGAKDDPEKCYHPGLPHDEFGAEGFEEQFVFVIPSQKLVVVRLGVSHHGFDDVGLVQKIMSALPNN